MTKTCSSSCLFIQTLYVCISIFQGGEILPEDVLTELTLQKISMKLPKSHAVEKNTNENILCQRDLSCIVFRTGVKQKIIFLIYLQIKNWASFKNTKLSINVKYKNSAPKVLHSNKRYDKKHIGEVKSKKVFL